MSYIKEFINKKRIINPLGIGDAIGLCIVASLFMLLSSYLLFMPFIPKSIHLFVTSSIGYYLSIIILLKFYSKYDYNDSYKIKKSFSYKQYGIIILFFIGYLLINNLTIMQIVNLFIANSKNYKNAALSISGSNLFLALICISTIGPICEEIIFRGIILEGLLKKYNYKKAIFLSALLFSISHGNIPQFINTFFAGLILGYFYYKTSSLKPCIFIHITNNSIGLILFKCIELIPVLNGPLGFILGVLLLISAYLLYSKVKTKPSEQIDAA